MKTKLLWQHLPNNLAVLPVDEKILVITQNGDLFFAEFDSEELWVETPEDFEDDEVDVAYWARVALPEDL